MLMIFQSVMVLCKTFSYLRMFESLAKLVILIQKVALELRPFLFFWAIMMLMFAIIQAIIGVGNEDRDPSGELAAEGVNDITRRLDSRVLQYFFTVFKYSFADFGSFP